MRLRLAHRSTARAGVAAAAASLAIAVLSPLGPATAAAPGPDLKPAKARPQLVNTIQGDKAQSSKLAKTPKSLTKLTSAAKVPVMIKFDYDALASYAGSVKGYAATSPSVTGADLDATSADSTKYLGYLAGKQASISKKITSAVPGVVLGAGYSVVYGGVSASVPGNKISKILAVPGVVAVQPDELRQPLDDASNEFINAGPAYTAVGGEPTAGAGVLLGNIDSGVWPEHPAFAARTDLPAYDGPALACDFGDNPLTPEDDPFVCNNKLVGGEAFLTTYLQFNAAPTYLTARDSEGHGSHTASTSAGNIVDDVQTLGPVVPEVAGIAPGAQVAEYRVCGSAGCYSSDSAAAVEQAVADGVDVINYSISGSGSVYTDAVELAFLDAYDAGVFVAASAGNSGPGAATSDHASPWVTTVGASTQEREFTSHLTLTAGNGDTFEADGASITAGLPTAPVVWASAAPYNRVLCDAPAAAGTFTGKIVACQRGGNGRVEKGFNVLQGGAVGMILYNASLADVETDNHWLPAVHLADGTAFVAFLGSHSNVTASSTDGESSTGQGDVMASFSSRGPLGNFLKPDVTAPGVQILAAMTPTPDEVSSGPAGEYWQAIAGTSMSSPHVAGAALLVRAVHPDWSPGQIKSALMTQAVTDVLKEDLTTPADPFDMGAGRVDVGAAIAAPLTISDDTADMVALFNDPDHAIDLNIASINAPRLPGEVTTTRTVTNVTGSTLRVKPSVQMPAGSSMVVKPKAASVAPGASATFTIKLSSTTPLDSQQFGSLTFTTPAGAARLPVAFKRAQGAVALEQTCSPTSIPKGGRTDCTVTATNTSLVDQEVTISTRGNEHLKVLGGPTSRTETLSGGELGVPSMGSANPLVDGYVDLGDFTGSLVQPIGDESITNFNVPDFVFNGVTYSRIGVDSNGYLVAGGGTSGDNQCCDLPGGPSPAAPNNIIAPFWTDLDGTGETGISLNVLTDGTHSWLIVQWQANDYGTSDLREFQAWIGVDGTQDITYTYAAPQSAPASDDFLVGAENALGAGDMQAILPDDPIGITSSDATPGGSLSYDLRARGVGQGLGLLQTRMTGPGLAGVANAVTRVQVTGPQ
jgi:hypothetical protein